MAYKFIQTIDPDNEHCRVNIEFDIPNSDLTTEQIIEIFEYFMKACGYSIGNIVEIKDKNE